MNEFHDTLSSKREPVASVISLESLITTGVIQVHYSLPSSSYIKTTTSKITECRPEFIANNSVLTNCIVQQP